MSKVNHRQLFSCAGEEKLQPVHFRTCLHYEDYACHHSQGDNCNGNMYVLYDDNALEEFIKNLNFFSKNQITLEDLFTIKQYINSFQLTLYPPKTKDKHAPEYVRPLYRDDLLCDKDKDMIELYKVIAMITEKIDEDVKSDTEETLKLKQLIKTKLSFIPKRITSLCKGTHTDVDMQLLVDEKQPAAPAVPKLTPLPGQHFKKGGRRHTKKRNRRQRKTRQRRKT